MIDLNRYGIAEQWPKLAKLQAEVRTLERRRDRAEGELMAARQAVERAREQDAEAAAKAIRAGRDVPAAKHEQKAKAQLEASERTLAAFGKALESAQADLGTFMAERSEEIQASVLQALREASGRIRGHVTAVLPDYALIMDSKYDVRQLAPQRPVEEVTGTGRDSVDFGGIVSRANVYGEPFERGHVEAMLSYLAALEDRYAVAVETSRDTA